MNDLATEQRADLIAETTVDPVVKRLNELQDRLEAYRFATLRAINWIDNELPGHARAELIKQIHN